MKYYFHGGKIMAEYVKQDVDADALNVLNTGLLNIINEFFSDFFLKSLSIFSPKNKSF